MSTETKTLRQNMTLSERWALIKRALAGDESADYTALPMRQAIALLAVPMVLEMCMEALFAITDIFWVAALGPDAIASVGITEAVVTLLEAIVLGVGMATTAMVARRFGEKKMEDASIVSGQALWVGLIVAALFGIAGVLFPGEILRTIGASESVVATGSGYTQVMMGGSLTITYLFLINAIFRGAGDATIAMRSLWIANGINIVLDPILIFGLGPAPEMGVTGAAVATTIGRGTGVLYQLYHLTTGSRRLAVHRQHLIVRLDVMRRLAKVSVGGVLQFLIGTASWVVMMRIVAAFGSEAVAGYTLAIRIVVFTILPAWGMANAAATLVGQNLGAGHPDRAEAGVWLTARYNMIFLLSVAAVFIFYAEPVLRLFTDDVRVIRYGESCLRMFAYGYGFYGLGMILIQAFNGAGDTRTPTWINFLCFWIVQIPLAWTLAVTFKLGPDGVFISLLVAEMLLTAIALWIFKRGRWKLTVV